MSAMICADAAIEIFVRRAEVTLRDAAKIAQVLLPHRLVEMVLGFEIGDHFRRQFALAVKGAAGREAQK